MIKYLILILFGFITYGVAYYRDLMDTSFMNNYSTLITTELKIAGGIMGLVGAYGGIIEYFG